MIFVNFQELLSTENQNEDRFPIVFLKDVKFSDLEAIIKFIYTGKTQVSAANLSTCTQLAKTLGVTGFTNYIQNTSPTKKRKSSDFNKENTAVQWSTSEPIALNGTPTAETEPIYQNLKRRKIHSLDNVCDTFVTPPKPFQATPSPTKPVKASQRTASCPVDSPLRSANSRPGSSSTVAETSFPQATMLNNFSFDSTFSSLNAANILQTLAMWMMEEQKTELSKDHDTSAPVPPAPPNSLKSNPSSISRSPRKNTDGNEADRPDSGFDSNNESGTTTNAHLHTAQVSETISEEAGVRTASSGDTSPDVIEISRQAPIRQPVFRKRRIHQ